MNGDGKPCQHCGTTAPISSIIPALNGRPFASTEVQCSAPHDQAPNISKVRPPDLCTLHRFEEIGANICRLVLSLNVSQTNHQAALLPSNRVRHVW
ncbi:hypothetical protein BaRGS_00010397 [Batillaria attramentaria]|uniref:Uncharacterized protein n=1 Tax=Batillaria attramentaria TaxID=370345 RepID=A0ABD0LGD8_9CAEN